MHAINRQAATDHLPKRRRQAHSRGSSYGPEIATPTFSPWHSPSHRSSGWPAGSENALILSESCPKWLAQAVGAVNCTVAGATSGAVLRTPTDKPRSVERPVAFGLSGFDVVNSYGAPDKWDVPIRRLAQGG